MHPVGVMGRVLLRVSRLGIRRAIRAVRVSVQLARRAGLSGVCLSEGGRRNGRREKVRAKMEKNGAYIGGSHGNMR